MEETAEAPVHTPPATPSPDITALPEDELVSKAANIKTTPPSVEEPGNGTDAPVHEPANSFDQQVFDRNNARGNPQSHMQLSSVKKGSVKVSNKKTIVE